MASGVASEMRDATKHDMMERHPSTYSRVASSISGERGQLRPNLLNTVKIVSDRPSPHVEASSNLTG